jgi:creatinine amidohydrolase/Fe(II)-dependent formamide hydrolase-like protein
VAPTLYLGSFALNGVGTVATRQRVVRDAVQDWGASLARAGFRYILVASGHAGPGHLVALEEAAQRVSRRHGVTMASLAGGMVWALLRGRYHRRLEVALGRPLTREESRALADDAHGGLLETSLMLWIRPDLVDGTYRDLPPARYSLLERLRPDYPLRAGGRGYAGHPALADPELARALASVVLDEAAAMALALLDGRVGPRASRSPFFALPFFRTDFWPAVGLAAGALALYRLLRRR